MIRELEFKILYQRNSDEIYPSASSILGNDANAEAATLAALFHLCQNLADVQFLKARAWIYRTTRNF